MWSRNCLLFRSTWGYHQGIRVAQSLVFCVVLCRLLSVLLWFTTSCYLFGIFDLRLPVTSLVSLIYDFLLPLWYLWFTTSCYLFGIFKLVFLTNNNVTKLGSYNGIHRKERWSAKRRIISIYFMKNDTSIYWFCMFI